MPFLRPPSCEHNVASAGNGLGKPRPLLFVGRAHTVQRKCVPSLPFDARTTPNRPARPRIRVGRSFLIHWRVYGGNLSHRGLGGSRFHFVRCGISPPHALKHCPGPTRCVQSPKVTSRWGATVRPRAPYRSVRANYSGRTEAIRDGEPRPPLSPHLGRGGRFLLAPSRTVRLEAS